MPCHVYRLPGGGTAIVKMAKRRVRPCCVCGKPGGKLCDYPLRGAKRGKTCDRSLCSKCAVHREPDTDYCPTHAQIAHEDEQRQIVFVKSAVDRG